MEIVVTLLVVGAILLLLETVLPGMIAGIVGMICLAIGVVLGYERFGAQTGNLISLLVLTALVFGAILWLKFFPQSRAGKIFMSQRAVGDIGATRPELLHQAGTAISALRPSGMALINGQRIDVITEGPHVESGAAVKVIAVEGLRVVVRAVS
ncbi:MAG: hypothetical protein HY043_20710 [Verrucomicrobia bacterium]|nr:hypothetical protein [Verrucomicrobiota bacterium]